MELTKEGGQSMPQSLTRIYIHLVFGTKHRHPWLNESIRPMLHAFMAGSFRKFDSQMVCVGGMSDHIHALFRLSKNHRLSDVVERLKTDSSVWLKTQGKDFADFAWQNGYGAFSVDASRLQMVVNYVSSQEQHHRRLSFKQEVMDLFLKHKLDYQEKFFWD
jgi:putative transposase